MKRFFQFAISFVLAAVILYALLRRFDVTRTMEFVRQADPLRLWGGIGLMIVAYLLRGARWQIWERSLSYWNSLQVILIGFMGNNVLPARLGEVLRAHCAAVKTSSDRGRTAAIASIAAERILDGLVIAVFGLVALALVPVDPRLRWVLLAISLVFAGLTSGMVVGLRFHERLRGAMAAFNRKFPGHLTAFALEKANYLLDGLLPLGQPSRMLLAIVTSFVIWSIEIVFYLLLGRAIWPELNTARAMLFLVVVNFASLIPFTMGGIGTIEAVATVSLVSAGVPEHPAFAMVLLQHAAQYFFTTISGGVLYLLGGFHRIPLNEPKRKTEPAATPQAAEANVPSTVLLNTRSRLDELGEAVELKPGASRTCELSIVIPAYNEQNRLPKTVLETIHWCTTHKLDFELVIADDGSRDETLQLAHLFEESDARVRALACPHMGKGATVRMGMLNARGNKILFMDADGATPLDEIPKLMAALDGGQDVAIGSRVVQHPGEVEVKTSLHRRFIGRVFALAVNIFAIEGIADTQCGFKMFRRDAAVSIFSRQKTAGFAFDVEILYIARRLSLSIREIPVNWVAQPGSKVNLVTDSMKMLWDITHIRWLHRSFK